MLKHPTINNIGKMRSLIFLQRSLLIIKNNLLAFNILEGYFLSGGVNYQLVIDQ